jgi:hypothetical protein
MKKTILILFSTAAIFSSCTKNKNVIKGIVTYKDGTGLVNKAYNATVNIMSTEDKAGLSFTYQAKTALDGTYSVNQVDDGEWYVYATYTEDTLTYKGKTDLFKVKGDDEVVRDLTLNR